MLKRLVIGITALIISTTSFAIGAPYLGVTLATNMGNLQLRNAGTVTTLQAKGQTLGVLAGFGADLENNFYLAAEIFGNAATTHTLTQVINKAGTTAKIKMGTSYGVSLLPAIHIAQDALVFVRVGAVRGRFELTQILGSSRTIVTPTATGAEVGVGAQVALNNNILLRGEYNYFNYYSFRVTSSAVTSHNNQLAMSLLYRFL